MSRRSRRNEIYDRENLPEIEEIKETVPEEPEEVLITEHEPIAKGKVICEKLNVRTEPSTDSEVMTVIEKDQEVAINPYVNISDWYFIGIKNGPITVEGYAMSKFIEKE